MTGAGDGNDGNRGRTPYIGTGYSASPTPTTTPTLRGGWGGRGASGGCPWHLSAPCFSLPFPRLRRVSGPGSLLDARAASGGGSRPSSCAVPFAAVRVASSFVRPRPPEHASAPVGGNNASSRHPCGNSRTPESNWNVLNQNQNAGLPPQGQPATHVSDTSSPPDMRHVDPPSLPCRLSCWSLTPVEQGWDESVAYTMSDNQRSHRKCLQANRLEEQFTALR